MITQEDISALGAALQRSFTFELICKETLPAWYRRALMQNELATLDDTASNDPLERVFGRLGHDDPQKADNAK